MVGADILHIMLKFDHDVYLLLLQPCIFILVLGDIWFFNTQIILCNKKSSLVPVIS
jgi:hypothetical protein